MSRSDSFQKISFASVSPASRSSRSCSSYASPLATAFWKMLGFEVTPTTASSRISRSSSPVRSMSREIVSIQTLTPASLSLCRFDSGICHLPLHQSDLLETPHVPLAAVESRAQERADQLRRQRRADDLGAEAEDVHVVVLDALVGGVRVVADRGADAGDLAGGDGGADAGAADQDPALRAAAEHGVADVARLVRIVDAHG